MCASPSLSSLTRKLFRQNFQPSFQPAFHVTSFQSNTECDVYMRKNLYVNVVLSSGTNIVLEVGQRLTKGLTASAPSAMESKVVLPTNDIILTADAKTLPLRGSVVPVKLVNENI